MPAQPPHLPPAVIDAIRLGNKIEAIKILREVRGISLKDAKEAVDAYAEGRPAPRSGEARGPIVEAGASWLPWLVALVVATLLGYFYNRQ